MVSSFVNFMVAKVVSLTLFNVILFVEVLLSCDFMMRKLLLNKILLKAIDTIFLHDSSRILGLDVWFNSLIMWDVSIKFSYCLRLVEWSVETVWSSFSYCYLNFFSQMTEIEKKNREIGSSIRDLRLHQTNKVWIVFLALRSLYVCELDGPFSFRQLEA